MKQVVPTALPISHMPYFTNEDLFKYHFGAEDFCLSYIINFFLEGHLNFFFTRGLIRDEKKAITCRNATWRNLAPLRQPTPVVRPAQGPRTQA